MSNKNVNVRKSQEITFCLLAGILMFMAMMVAGRAEAGVALGATRVIYPAGQKQVQLAGNDSNLLIVFYVQIMPDDLVMQLHRF